MYTILRPFNIRFLRKHSFLMFPLFRTYTNIFLLNVNHDRSPLCVRSLSTNFLFHTVTLKIECIQKLKEGHVHKLTSCANMLYRASLSFFLCICWLGCLMAHLLYIVSWPILEIL